MGGGGGGGGLVTSVTDSVGLTDSGAGDRALAAQQGAANKSNAFQQKMYKDSKKMFNPFLKGGQESYQDLRDTAQNFQNFGEAPGAFQGHSGVFGMSDFQKDPGYEFRMKEGQRGIENSAAARGRTNSGAALKALAKYGQDYASNEYGNSYNRFNNDYNNAYNRHNSNQANQFNRLSSLANYGVNAANSISGLNSNLATNFSNTQASLGNAAASNEMSRNMNGMGGLWDKGMQLGTAFLGSKGGA